MRQTDNNRQRQRQTQKRNRDRREEKNKQTETERGYREMDICHNSFQTSIAVTQNFVSRRNLPNVINFLRKKTSHDLYNSLTTSLKANYPGLLEEVTDE